MSSDIQKLAELITPASEVSRRVRAKREKAVYDDKAGLLVQFRTFVEAADSESCKLKAETKEAAEFFAAALREKGWEAELQLPSTGWEVWAKPKPLYSGAGGHPRD
jgi:hypothetical protein